MKHKFSYNSCTEAMEALNHCLTKDFESNSIHEVDFWIREFIRDSDEDMAWLFSAVQNIGFGNLEVGKWFAIQAVYPELWTKRSHSLIKSFKTAFEDLS
nr:hypothetical protein [uncultured Flavobacterium sp.]